MERPPNSVDAPLNSLRSHLHRNRHDETGAAAVEFALISVLLFAILFGIIYFGTLFSQFQAFQGAAREGARLAAVRRAPLDVRNRVVDAAQPFDIDPNIVSVRTESGTDRCTTDTIGDKVTVRWLQRFTVLEMPFVPAVRTRVRIQGVFKCE